MRLEGLRDRLAHPERSLHACGAYLVGRAQRAFADQGRGGDSWPERAIPNRIGVLRDLQAGRQPPERRWDGKPAGVDTGRLRSSIAYRVEGNTVVVGSNLDYASDVQLGSSATIELDAQLRSALAAWLRKLSNAAKRAKRESYPAKEARYSLARAAFGPLFRAGALRVEVPPRPFLGVTDEDRRQLLAIVTAYIGGSAA